MNRPKVCFLLPVKVIAAPVRTASPHFVVEDPAGHAIPVQVFHVPARLHSDELSEWWPVGAVFGVKEPTIRSLRDGSYYIRIESPADLVRLYPSSPLLRDIDFRLSVRHPLDGKNVDELKVAGNKAFKEGRWAAAKEAYEWALDSLPSSADPSPSSLAPTLHSNLALTLIRLDFPASALRAADAGLALLADSSSDNPLGLKLIYRSSLALYALYRFTEALTRLDTLLEADPASSDALALRTRCRTRLVEQQSGPSASTLRSLFLSTRRTLASRKPLSTPDIANYLSPSLSIRPLPGRGNGLIALRPIKRGDLLMCLKPLAWAGRIGAPMEEEEGRLRYTAGLNLWTEQQDPWAVVECSSEVVWKLGMEGKEGREWSEVGELWAGDELGRAGAEAEDLPSRVEGIVTFNGFHLEEISSPSPEGDAETDLFHAPTALYPRHASALNHSCVPNVSYTFLSTLFILRARTDIGEGEELVDSYVDAAEELEGREGKLRGHGFVCECELCEEERSIGVEGRRRRQELVERAKKIGEEDLAIPGVQERLSALVAQLEATYSLCPPPRLRPALYVPLRLLSQSLALSSPSTGSLDSIRTELRALAFLGARFDGDEGEERMVAPPLLRDMDGVLSALWIAREWKRLGSVDKSRHWVALARDIEAGQAGAEVFDLRYGEWAARQGLDLTAQET
ncbi:hypothetical protein NBRC10512_005444 [Rhodotorula toruloides]|uniref:TPR and SET domain containing protein n=1 Tax=Rhodotorula toruloides (strain NP11) TaxID=1130832 RepID=M7WET0_RHOT1|nr:TPR and SET domain containing protein [Rhodotorula toruloides NP11]EMS18932.1 TPR and SET domain containing protein [Rhodotorula toruloides NP11]